MTVRLLTKIGATNRARELMVIVHKAHMDYSVGNLSLTGYREIQRYAKRQALHIEGRQAR